MKYGMFPKAFSFILTGMIKKDIHNSRTIGQIKKEYRAIVERADDIGENNMLISSYLLAAYFIAMCRNTGLSNEENRDIMKEGMKTSRLLKLAMGNADGYFSEKKMDVRRKWSAETHEHKYKNDWVVDVLEKTGDFEFGLDYTECGVCKLCKDEGCPELAVYLCSLDFMLVEVMGVHLDRTMTLAEGKEKCDFRFSRK